MDRITINSSYNNGRKIDKKKARTLRVLAKTIQNECNNNMSQSKLLDRTKGCLFGINNTFHLEYQCQNDVKLMLEVC